MNGTREHIIEDRTFVIVWAVLLLLTAILVGASHVSTTAAVWAMVFLTPLKAGLVFYYFMHLKYESTLLKAMVCVALSTLVVFISLLFLDISFR